ncbi:MAG TPA: hypothetical protein VHX38_35655 [Pseudonocardiaceae bacterium]|jgi:hypothetical protein|nr:hypothetical protein [Pseudonocardiaceae bacterium]
MTTNSADYDHHADYPRPLTVEELARQQGITRLKTIEDLTNDAPVDSDDDGLDEFLAYVREQRNGSLA